MNVILDLNATADFCACSRRFFFCCIFFFFNVCAAQQDWLSEVFQYDSTFSPSLCSTSAVSKMLLPLVTVSSMMRHVSPSLNEPSTRRLVPKRNTTFGLYHYYDDYFFLFFFFLCAQV